MVELKVEIRRLEPIQVVSAVGFGESPELLAQEKILTWARAKGWLETSPPPRFFGFNNPDPEEGLAEYGYEFWMTLPEGSLPKTDLEIKSFEGGLYATVECQNPYTIPETWQALMDWLNSSRYELGKHQWLEEYLKFIDLPVEEYEFRLYLPITERRV